MNKEHDIKVGEFLVVKETTETGLFKVLKPFNLKDHNTNIDFLDQLQNRGYIEFIPFVELTVEE